MKHTLATVALALTLFLTQGATLLAHDPAFTDTFDRSRCTFTTVGSNPYFPLWPGYAQHYAGDQTNGPETIHVTNIITVLPETLTVDGVATRVVEERESEDGELVEVSRNFFALCRETGDVWYFGEDVDDYEDGTIVGHGGAWRAGVAGAAPGIVMPGTPLLGARHFQERAPGVALDFAEIVSLTEQITVPAGTFQNLLKFDEGSALGPGTSEKWYAHGVGLVKDDELDLVSITPPPCQPGPTTLCLNNGRFLVQADWTRPTGEEGDGKAILPSAEAGEFWFFRPDNTELIVKVLNACSTPGAPRYWVFIAGLTNLEVTVAVTDTKTHQTKEYDNAQGHAFTPILDTNAFATCP